MFLQAALARTSRITPSPVVAQVHFFTLRFTARNAKMAKFSSVFDIFSKFFRGNDPGENVHESSEFHTATMKNGGHDISHWRLSIWSEKWKELRFGQLLDMVKGIEPHDTSTSNRRRIDVKLTSNWRQIDVLAQIFNGP